MTDEQSFDEDPQLRALLGQSDPARSLTPADPQGLARLLEDTVSHDLDTRTDLPQQTTELRRRGPLAWLVAAAAVAGIAGGGYAAVSSMQDPGTVEQAGSSTSPVDEPVVVTLEAPATVPAKCAVPTPELLGGAEVAFAGTVTAIVDDVVTIAPTDTYAGESAEEIVVVGVRPDLRALGGQPEFVVGGTYLVAATGGQVSTCGFSGEASPELQNLYDLAFR